MNDIWGTLPEAEGWVEWFAWRPVLACGQWRWLDYVQRRRNPANVPPWLYVAGRAHDYPDGELGAPAHFHTHTCRHCGARFSI
jgi:hypothetical protein